METIKTTQGTITIDLSSIAPLIEWGNIIWYWPFSPHVWLIGSVAIYLIISYSCIFEKDKRRISLLTPFKIFSFLLTEESGIAFMIGIAWPLIWWSAPFLGLIFLAYFLSECCKSERSIPKRIISWMESKTLIDFSGKIK